METIKVRTTMRPDEEIDVGPTEFVDLVRQDLLVEVEGQRRQDDPTEQGGPHVAGKDATPKPTK